MENIKKMCEFIKADYPKDCKDVVEALDLLTLALDGVYDSIAKNINDSIIAQQLDQIPKLSPRLQQVINVKKTVDDFSNLLLDGDEIYDEIKTEKIEEIEKKEIPNYSDYAIDTSIPHSLYEDYTYTKACGFRLHDTDYEARNMRGVIVRLCEVLAEKDENKVLSFINDPSMKGRKASYFSNRLIIEDEIIKNEQIADLNVYVWTNSSCNQIRNVIKRILKKFDLPYESFKIYLRADYKALHNKESLLSTKLITIQEEERIGKYVQSCFDKLAAYEFTQNELIVMQSDKWTLQTFGFSIPLIKKCDQKMDYKTQISINGTNRYWKKAYNINGELFFVASQWQHYHRERFDKWFKSLKLEGK